MKIYSLHKLLLLSGALLLTTNHAAALPVRASLYGFDGTNFLAKADLMAGLFGTCDSLFWSDLQGKYGEEGTEMGSLGFGYRHIYHHQRILGLYGFMDYSVSPSGESFWVASPGIESMGCEWDFRLNGYFPVNEHSKKVGPGVTGEILGIQQFASFTGHKQFDHLFTPVEEVGSGVDGEIGRILPCLNNSRVFLGGYYFNFHDEKSTQSLSSIQGISGRLEYPIRPNLVLHAIDTYDNFSHNTAIIGLQISFGGGCRGACPVEIRDRILDPVSRNLSTQYTGTSVPIIKTYKDQGESILVRDDIVFFTAKGGTSLNSSSEAENGTFENPLAGSSFNQTTIDAINLSAPNSNFYFTPGTYQFDPANANARISLHTGQSMWGRTSDYTLPAQGDERALFIGGIDLGVNFAAGNNRLDSIRLLDTVTSDGTHNVSIRVLEFENASNVVLFNDDISGRVTVTGDLILDNGVSGIYANNSQVVIKDCSISAEAIVLGEDRGLSFATAIGGNTLSNQDGQPAQDAKFTNNNFTIINSIISGSASVGGDNVVESYAAGIGGNSSDEKSADFVNNIFTIKNSKISGNTVIGSFNAFSNSATGIGGNNNAGSANFIDNTFVILNSSIEATATVQGDNIRNDVLNGGQNFSAGIGGNSVFFGPADFVNNNFTIFNTTINSTALVHGNNGTDNTMGPVGPVGPDERFVDNFATGIGGNAGIKVPRTVPSTQPTAKFIGNNFDILSDSISSAAIVEGNNFASNFATGIGGNAGLESTSPLVSTATFMDNNFNIQSSNIDSTSLVKGNNSNSSGTGYNFSTGIGGNDSNLAGAASFIDNIFNINDSTISANALVNGINTGTNEARGVNMDGGGNTTNIARSLIDVLAQASGGMNTAVGLLATGVGDVINIFDSKIHTSAVPAGTATCEVGNVNLTNTACVP